MSLDQTLEARELKATIAELEYVVKKFGEWYSEHGCPFTSHDICLGGEKELHEEKQLEDAEEDRFPFDADDNCGNECQGSCWAKYYAKEWRDKQTEKKD